MQKQLKIYFKNIKKNLPCLNSAMGKMLADLKLSVDTYIKDNSIVDFQKIIEHFGTAEDVAKEFAIGIDNAYVKSYKLKKRIIAIIISLIAAIMIAVFALVAYIIADGERNQPTYYNDKIIYQEDK